MESIKDQDKIPSFIFGLYILCLIYFYLFKPLINFYSPLRTKGHSIYILNAWTTATTLDGHSLLRSTRAPRACLIVYFLHPTMSTTIIDLSRKSQWI